MAQIVPVTSAPNQQIRAALTVNGQSLILNLSLYWNGQGNFWAMDIADRAGNPVVDSVPLLSGAWPAGNILAPYNYLGIGSAYVINQNGAATDSPDSTNLGTGFLLLWDDNPAQ
jgi:hypothetical protein